MAGINIFQGPVPEVVPTICVQVSSLKQLTLVSDAHMLGWLGFAAGFCVPVLFYLGAVYVAPWVITKLGWE